MKVTINIDCTPQEARAFLGLPDFEAVQRAVVEGLEARLKGAIADMDAETLLKMWAPPGMKGWEELQKAFWSGFAAEKGGESAKE